MKKRLLSILLISSLTIMSLVACGASDDSGKEDEKKQDTIVEVSGESTGSDGTEDLSGATSVTGEGVMVEGPDEDDGVIEVEGDVVEIVEGEVTESTETKDDDTSDDTTDWSIAYDDYFSRDNIMPTLPKITANATGGGMTFEMVVAMVENTAFMSYDFGTVAMDMYVTSDKAYVRTEMEGQETWVFASITSEEVQDMAAGIEDNITLIDNEAIGAVTYREALEEDGVIYDVLDVTIEDGSGVPGTAVYFIKRETQLIAKCVMERQDSTAVCLVEAIESIELPAEATDATEVPIEDVLAGMAGVLFAGAGMAEE